MAAYTDCTHAMLLFDKALGGIEMYRIAICDDEEQFNITLEQQISDYAARKGIDVDVERYLTPDDFFEDVDKDRMCDILFLDIELDGETGIEVGWRIRDDLKNESVQIIYVSSKTDYAIKLFDIRPMNFLVKPISYERLSYVLDEYERLFGFSTRFFTYKKGKKEYRISENSIIYLQSIGKKVEIVTVNGKDEFYGKLSDTALQLNEQLFCVVHKSYVINKKFVRQYMRESVKMTNGADIPVSRSMQQKVQREISNDFWK